MARRRTWIWIIVGVVAVLLVGLLAIVAGTFFFVTRNVSVQGADATSAEAAFQEARGRFKDQTPLIRIEESEDDWARRPDVSIERDRPRAPGTIERLQVLAWDPDEDRLVRASIPMWLLRLGGNEQRFDFGSSEVDLERLRLTIEDIEQYGPGLLLDHRDRRGVRLLLWTE